MAASIQLRRDLAANWAAINPVLLAGEIGVELDVNPLKFKIGDGTTVWNSIPYSNDTNGALEKNLMNGVDTALVDCLLANNTIVTGVLDYSIQVFDGTDLQGEEGSISYIITNKAGTISNNSALKIGNQQAVTSGTLTVNFMISATNPAVIQVNANSSLTPSAGYPKVTYTLRNLTQQAFTIL